MHFREFERVKQIPTSGGMAFFFYINWKCCYTLCSRFLHFDARELAPGFNGRYALRSSLGQYSLGIPFRSTILICLSNCGSKLDRTTDVYQFVLKKELAGCLHYGKVTPNQAARR